MIAAFTNQVSGQPGAAQLALPRYSQANRTGLTPTRFAGRADLTPEDAGRVDDFHGQP